jgi:2-polyprenyl-3-methyl-5-hydroxy-6-metoxy-1,4-benzoquinol methylase
MYTQRIDQISRAEGLRYSLKTDRYSSHRQIADWLRRYKMQTMPDRACVVYDIGCAQGILGQLLDPDHFILFGVDADPAVAMQARSIYRDVMVADIEKSPPFSFPHPPDVMVLADVLEHTRDPECCLDYLCRACLAPKARVIVSLPNVAHLYYRLALLVGRFEYIERGPLDRTHLRFFTLSSAIKLAQACGVSVNQVAVTPVPLPLLNPLFEEGRPLWPLYYLQVMLARLFKTVLGYQVIMYGSYCP